VSVNVSAALPEKAPAEVSDEQFIAHAGLAVWSSLLWEPIGAATVAKMRPG
jgi:hypothetical protein